MRIVPRVERGECLNVGIILFARTVPYLDARVELDPERLRALYPDLELAPLQRHANSFLAICSGATNGGPLATLPPSDRFHWLTAPRSTTIQTSPVHVGRCHDPAATLETLMSAYVRTPVPR